MVVCVCITARRVHERVDECVDFRLLSRNCVLLLGMILNLIFLVLICRLVAFIDAISRLLVPSANATAHLLLVLHGMVKCGIVYDLRGYTI